MTIKMPKRFATKSGVFFLNVRVPADLVGTRHTLRTKDIGQAKSRFIKVYETVVRHWERLRAGPKPLPHKQIVALAGHAYRRRAARFEDDVDYGPHVLEAVRDEMRDAIAYLRYGARGVGDPPLSQGFGVATLGTLDLRVFGSANSGSLLVA